MQDNEAGSLVVEPFYGGSHAQLVNLLMSAFGSDLDLVEMSATKWHWRARTSALWLSVNIPHKRYKKLFITAVVNLAELLGLRRDLVDCEKILYFHENQLEYPTQEEKHRDYQYGYNQILSAMVADKVIFNSEFNMISFLSKVDSFLNRQPDYHTACRDSLESKCSVVYFPITIDRFNGVSNNSRLHIVWPHRWEHDKGPKEFFETLNELKQAGCQFEVSVLGESYNEVPDEFILAKSTLNEHIRHWGYLESKQLYLSVLRQADVVVSTALHEFYGVAVLEAAFSGAFPLVPNRLSYPELFPKDCVYNTRRQLFKMLKNFCQKPSVARERNTSLDLSKFHWNSLRTKYSQLLFE